MFFFFEKLLNFGSQWHVERVVINIDNKIDIFLKFDLQEYKNIHLETYEFIYDYSDFRRWLHLNILQLKTFINAKIPCIKDKNGKITSVKIPWTDNQ